jgi:hypothetical protein
MASVFRAALALNPREGDGRNERGMATLAYLPVHLTQSQPYLAGLAMHRTHHAS